MLCFQCFVASLMWSEMSDADVSNPNRHPSNAFRHVNCKSRARIFEGSQDDPDITEYYVHR